MAKNACSDWFVANKAGLRQISERLVERRGFGIVGAELYQNVMDTGATECAFTIEKVPGRALVNLTVTDNDPNGFVDLTHAWTLFAPSAKKIDPTKAGRFNLGEKMVLSFCRSAKIHTTTGTVEFNEEGRTDFPRRKRSSGTEFSCTIDCTSERYDELIAYMRKIIVRPGLVVSVNGERIEKRDPLLVFRKKLPTEFAGESGELRSTVRQTNIEIYEPLEGEVPMLYELGIPVVETGDKWHYNVIQKVPLNIDRDNVTPSFMSGLRVHVFNAMHERLTQDDISAEWVNVASSSENCTGEAVETFRIMKFGKSSVVADPKNPEANAEAINNGFTLIPARGLTPGQRENLYNAGTLISSSKKFPYAGLRAYANGPAVEFIPWEKLTVSMQRLQNYAFILGEKLLKMHVEVKFINDVSLPWMACFRELSFGREIHFNIGHLGDNWFRQDNINAVDSLILHELSHEFEQNHLKREFAEAGFSLGAKLKEEVLKDPEWFRSIFTMKPRYLGVLQISIEAISTRHSN